MTIRPTSVKITSDDDREFVVRAELSENGSELDDGVYEIEDRNKGNYMEVTRPLLLAFLKALDRLLPVADDKEIPF